MIIWCKIILESIKNSPNLTIKTVSGKVCNKHYLLKNSIASRPGLRVSKQM